MKKAEILIIDDEVQIRKLLRITLESNDYLVKEAESGKQGIALTANHPPELILLDLGLPDQSGHEVLKDLREWYTAPVIILSVQSSEEDIIRALDNGANDYLIKPFRTGELLARIRSSLKMQSNDLPLPVLTFGEIVINLVARTVTKKEQPIKLTSTEYNLLTLLAKNEGKVLTHQYLLREVWGPGYIDQSQYLRVFIAQLRKKIEDDPNRPKYITTEAGIGYRLTAAE